MWPLCLSLHVMDSPTSEFSLLGDASYWAVAIVKKLDQSINLTAAGLKGKSSCHTGYQKSAGWNMPMGMLKSLGKF